MSELVLLLAAGFAVLLLMGVPISVGLVLAASAAIVVFSDFDLSILPLKLFGATDSFPLIAIPFFVFAGSLMSRGGMSDRLIDLARALVGRFSGGVAMVSIVACMLFAAISGSTAATTAAIGIVLIPAMIQSGFSRGTAVGLQATAGSIGIIIPPSVPFVLLGVIANISIGELFLGGVLPGVTIGVALMVMAFIIAKLGGHKPAANPAGGGAVALLRTVIRSIAPLLTLILVIGGILLGLVTPTEAAIVAVVWALLVGAVFPRLLTLTARLIPAADQAVGWADRWLIPGDKQLNAGGFAQSVGDTVNVTGIVVLCIGATAPFAWLLTVEQVPQQLADAMLQLTDNANLIKLMVVVLLLGIGTFLDLTPAMILLVPILMPITNKLGMDPVHFGVMLVLALGIGQSTPPVGISLFVACSVGKAKMSEVILPILPFLAAMILVLLLVTYWPAMSVWLPQLLMR